MPELDPQASQEIAAATAAGAAEIAQALARTFNRPIEAGEATVANWDEIAAGDRLAGPGLAVVLCVGSQAAVVLITESSGWLPSWYEHPDPTGQSKLTTLAQELGMLVLPEAMMPEDFKASRVESLSAALSRGNLALKPGAVQLHLKSDESHAMMHVVWPVASPQNVLDVPALPSSQSPEPASRGSEAGGPAIGAKWPAAAAGRNPEPQHGLSSLPGYAQSLLKIRVPVTVTLAAKKHSVGRIVELGPGSIIQFEKACDEMLELAVGDRLVAEGEAVKVGEKFGIRVTSLLLPPERFASVRSARG